MPVEADLALGLLEQALSSRACPGLACLSLARPKLRDRTKLAVSRDRDLCARIPARADLRT